MMGIHDTPQLSGWLWKAAFVGSATGILATLGAFARREIRRRGYPSWEHCRCEYKVQPTVYHVLYSRHERRGETIVSQEWGISLPHPPLWLRRLLHHSSQALAALHPFNSYVERVTLSPQEAYQLAALLRGNQENDLPLTTQVAWKREVLRLPRHLFDHCIRRLYPVEIQPERITRAQPLPALWDLRSNLPLPFEGNLLATPPGTRIDYIGWTPAQISYCTARLARQHSRA